MSHSAFAQEPLLNGFTHQTSIAPVGNVDAWTFEANVGDRIVIRVGEITQTNTLNLRLTLLNPNAVTVASTSDASAAEIAITATNTGTFTLNVDDVGSDATGTYRLTLGQTGRPVVIAPDDEGGALTNGYTRTGALGLGELDVWTVSATAGQSLVVRMGEITDSNNFFAPSVRIYSPAGPLLDSGENATAGEVTVTATNTGDFLVVVADGDSVLRGAGTYRLTLGQTGRPVVIAPDDEGGALTNGYTRTGALGLGELDVWTVSATAGQSLVVRMGEVTDSNSLFAPWVRIYSPAGPLLDSGENATAGEVTVTATNTGDFLVVVADGDSVLRGAGTYRLTLGQTGRPVAVATGDEGGALNGTNTYDGTLEAGDLDVWSFTICAGELIMLRIDELIAGSSLVPQLRLYGRDGKLIRSVSGAATAQINMLATNTGTFTVMAGDGDSVLRGAGDYRLTVNGLSDDLRLCDPKISGTNVTVSGVGGPSGAEFTVFTSTLVEAPLDTWTPLFTNQFDFYGTFSHTNLYVPGEPKRFFILQQQ